MVRHDVELVLVVDVPAEARTWPPLREIPLADHALVDGFRVVEEVELARVVDPFHLVLLFQVLQERCSICANVAGTELALVEVQVAEAAVEL